MAHVKYWHGRQNQKKNDAFFIFVIKGSEMTTQESVFAFAMAALLVATPATGQLLNHPVQALPQGPADGATFAAVQFARGLNDNSGKQNSFAAAVGRGMERVSVSGSAGYVASDTDELTLAASVAVHLLSDDSTPVQVSVQGGFGWASIDGTPDNLSLTRFPVGVAISARPADSGTSIRPWIMPRLDIERSSLGGVSNTESDIGVSGGVALTSESGAGFHVAGDWVNVEGGSPFGISVGAHYVLGR
jgi:hypothetical protein